MDVDTLQTSDNNAWSGVPHNVEAEAALLGGLMSGELDWLVDRAADQLTASSFYEPVHGRIFDAIVRQHALGKSTSPVLIKGYLDGDEGMKALGGISYLARLTADLSCLISPQEFVKQVADLAARRKVMGAMKSAYERASDVNEDLREIVGSIDTDLDATSDDGIIESDMSGCLAAWEEELEAERFGVTCKHIGVLDDLWGALEPKSLTILAARPGAGKTGVASNYALGAAINGHGVSFISLEMSRQQLMGRMIAHASFDNADRRIDYTSIQNRALRPPQREYARALGQQIKNLPMRVVDGSNLGIGRLERIIRKQKRAFAAAGQKLELVVIDYLQLLRVEGARRSPYETISEISMRLKGLAKSNEVAVLALAQLSRSVEQRPDKRPILSDLRDSGQIEQDADAVLFLYREEYYLKKSEPQDDPDAHADWEEKMRRCQGNIDFILAKRRNGPEGTARGRYYAPYQAVRS